MPARIARTTSSSVSETPRAEPCVCGIINHPEQLMAEWYVQKETVVTGPFTVPQMKAQAATGLIKPDTQVRKGRSGKWFLAKQVKGLLAATPESTAPSTTKASETSGKKIRQSKAKHETGARAEQRTGARESRGKAAVSTSPQVTGVTTEEDSIFLAPARKRKPRLILYGVLVVFMLIGQAPWYQQLAFDLCMGLIIGTYPLVEITRRKIERTWIVFFYPAYKQTWKLRDFTAVETDVEPRIADTIGCLILLFFMMWFMFRLFDRIMPWMGGDFKLMLRQWDNERICIWQGNNTADFEANLALLESKGLRIS